MRSKCCGVPRTVLEPVLAACAVWTLGYIFYQTYKIDGGFTEWSDWSKCSASCGKGIQERSRNCTNPQPNFLGRHCLTDGSHDVEVKECELGFCPIDGNFTAWSEFGVCSKTCEVGVQKRIRTCQNPAPKYGGKVCDGVSEESRSCNSGIPCPVNGGFSNWSDFTKCSVTCGVGTKSRKRMCTNPAPKHGGKFCQGILEETHPCEIPCPTTLPPSTKPTAVSGYNTTSQNVTTK